LLFLGSQLAEILLDDIPVMRREFFADLLHDLFPFLLRQIAPTAVIADILVFDFALAFTPRELAFVRWIS